MALFTKIGERFNSIDLNVFITNAIVAVVLIVFGIFLGWLINSILKKLIEKADFEKTTKSSFISLFLTVIRWSIYLVFIILALDQLGIPELTSWLTNLLIPIPALVGALVLVAIGFAISIYLGDVIEESKILNWKILAKIIFYFVNYVFIVFALRTALISLDTPTLNIITIIFTAVISTGLVFWHVVRKK